MKKFFLALVALVATLAVSFGQSFAIVATVPHHYPPME